MAIVQQTLFTFAVYSIQVNPRCYKLEVITYCLTETLKTLEAKENPDRYKSQVTLAKRRIVAFEIAVNLLEKELKEIYDEK
jgi:hypothetical protein